MAICAALGIAASVGCHLDEGEYFGPVPDPEPAHLRWCLGDPQSLDPARYQLTLEEEIFINLFDPLVSWDERLSPQPGLAHRWRVSRRSRTFTFSLREEARFSNGRSITAEDVRYAVMRTLNPVTASNMADRLFPIKNAKLYNAGRVKLVQSDTLRFNAGDVVELLDRNLPDPNIRLTKGAPALRPEPVLTSEPYANIPEGAEVTVVELSADQRWAYVHHAAGEGVLGWVRRDRLDHPNANRAYRVAILDDTATERRTGSLLGKHLLSLPELLGVRVIDRHTVAFDLERPTPHFLLRAMGIFPVPREVVSRWPRSWFRPEHIVTSGPFHLQEWRPRHRLELVRSETYRDRDQVKLERISIQVADNPAARANLYYAGECDLATAPPHSYVPLLLGKGTTTGAPRKDVRESAWAVKTYITLNTARLKDVHLRRALARSVDRQELPGLLRSNIHLSQQWSLCHPASALSDAELKRCGLTREFPGEACIINGKQCYVPPLFPDLDLEQARQELSTARQEMGDQFPATVTIKYATQHPAMRSIAEWLQSSWSRNLGITARVEGQDLNTLLRDVAETPRFDAVVWGLSVSYHPEDWLLPAMTCGHAFNDSKWCDEEYEQRMALAQQEPRLWRRLRLLKRAEERIADQVPLIPLYNHRRIWLERPYVRDRPTTNHLHRAWIDPDWRSAR